MKKIENFRKGQIWLNIFKTDEDETIVTINKTYRGRTGEIIPTPFLIPRRGDIQDLTDCLHEFLEWENKQKIGA